MTLAGNSSGLLMQESDVHQRGGKNSQIKKELWRSMNRASRMKQRAIDEKTKMVDNASGV